MRHIHVVVLIQELLVRYFQHAVGYSHAGIGKINLSMLLVPAQRLHPQRLAIDPAEARNVVLSLLDRH